MAFLYSVVPITYLCWIGVQYSVVFNPLHACFQTCRCTLHDALIRCLWLAISLALDLSVLQFPIYYPRIGRGYLTSYISLGKDLD